METAQLVTAGGTNVLAPRPFLRSDSGTLWVTVVLWVGGGLCGEFGQCISKSPVNPGRGRCHHKTADFYRFAAGSREGSGISSESLTQPNPMPLHPLPHIHSHQISQQLSSLSYPAPQVCKRLRNGKARFIAKTHSRHQALGGPTD